MKRMGIFHRAAAVLAVAGLFVAQVAQAAQPLIRTSTPSAPAMARTAKDVALTAGGCLHGQVVDSSGVSKAQAKVALVHKGELVGTTSTDRDGRFEFTGLGGGVYQVETLYGGAAYRLWAPRTAPPAADDVALILTGDEVVRGQDGGLLSWLGNPWFLALLVGAAIAIPLALDHDSSS